MANSKGKIILVNAQVETFFGYTRDELIGQPSRCLFPSDSSPSTPAFATVTLRCPGSPGAQGASCLPGVRTAANFQSRSVSTPFTLRKGFFFGLDCRY